MTAIKYHYYYRRQCYKKLNHNEIKIKISRVWNYPASFCQIITIKTMKTVHVHVLSKLICMTISKEEL